MSLFNKKSNEEIKEDRSTQEERSNETLGMRIAAARKEHKYTQEEFSQLLGVTSQAVSKWENDISCPDIMLLPKISQLLEISIDELLGNTISQKKAEQAEVPKVDINKLSLRINITGQGKKPVNISLPMSMVKKFTKLGTGISNIVNIGSPTISNKQIEQIFELVDEGVTGEVLNITDEHGQNVIIEIS